MAFCVSEGKNSNLDRQYFKEPVNTSLLEVIRIIMLVICRMRPIESSIAYWFLPGEKLEMNVIVNNSWLLIKFN